MTDLLTFKFPTKIDYIPVARLATSYLASLKNVDLDMIEDLRLVVTEACNLSYFINGDKSETSLEIELKEEEIVFSISSLTQDKIQENDQYLMSESIINSLADHVAYKDSRMVISMDLNGN